MPPKVIGPKRALSIELLLFFAYCFFQCLLDGWVHRHNGYGPGIRRVYHSSSVNNAISAAKILGNFVAAWILLKLGPKRTVSCPAADLRGGCRGVFHLFSAFILTRFLLGFGGAILMICMTPYVVYCFEPKQQPIFIGLNNAGPNTGNLIALLSVTARPGWLGSWRSVILFYGIFSVVFWFSGSLWVGDIPLRKKAKRRPSPPRSTAIGTAYEPFLYKFLFTMTGVW